MVVRGSEGSWVGRDLEHFYNEEEECDEVWTDYIELACAEIVSQPILGHSFMCGVSLGLAVTLSPSHLVPCTPRNSR